MNWGAAILILAGIGVVAVGITGSQKTVCQAITGSDCAWMPNPNPLGPEGLTGQKTVKGLPNEPQKGISIDNILSNCKTNSTCTGYAQIAYSDAQREGIGGSSVWVDDFVRQIAAESGFNPNAVSSSGAQGIAQLMPATSQTYHINPFDVNQSLNVAAQMMSGYESYWTNVLNSSLYGFSGNAPESEALALSSYNYGFSGTQNLVKQYGADWINHVPSETKNYIMGIEYPKQPITTTKVNG